MIFIMLFFEMASRLEETMVYMLTKARCMGIHSSPERRQHVERPTWRGSILPVPSWPAMVGSTLAVGAVGPVKPSDDSSPLRIWDFQLRSQKTSWSGDKPPRCALSEFLTHSNSEIINDNCCFKILAFGVIFYTTIGTVSWCMLLLSRFSRVWLCATP